MPTYVSLLRGINVSGHKKVEMARLRACVEAAGFDSVRSYIQSGNLVLRSSLRSPAKVSARLESAIAEEFGFEVPVVSRSLAAWRRVYESCPFSDLDSIDPARLSVVYFSGRPQAAGLEQLDDRRAPGDELELVGTELYLHLPAGAGTSKLDLNAIERVLGARATGRNWRTIGKLLEMAEAAG